MATNTQDYLKTVLFAISQKKFYFLSILNSPSLFEDYCLGKLGKQSKLDRINFGVHEN